MFKAKHLLTVKLKVEIKSLKSKPLNDRVTITILNGKQHLANPKLSDKSICCQIVGSDVVRAMIQCWPDDGCHTKTNCFVKQTHV